MHIENVQIKGIRAFPTENDVKVELGNVFTAIAGLNGTGKSTVLAVLGNVGNLHKKHASHLNGDPFRTELSEILKYDVGYDDSGGKAIVQFADDSSGMVDNIPPSGYLSFRSSIHSANNPTIKNGKKLDLRLDPRSRFRLIPQKKERPIPSEAKLDWPTYYLGLSRLFPVGETEDYSAIKTNLNEETYKVYSEKYRKILNIGQDVKNVGLITSASAARKKGSGVTTSSYGAVSNSAGQDNLGQIILAALSFKNLKESLGDRFRGGLLLIDEIEATLHPVAQTRLFDFLYETAKEVGFQVVCTTHSLSLLERISEVTHPKNDTVKIAYFRRTGSELEVVTNPSMAAIEADMNNQILAPGAASAYPRVFMEDDVARLVFRCIQQERFSDLQVRLPEGNLGWSSILMMANEFSAELSGALIVLDPDVSAEPENLITEKLSKSVFRHPKNELQRAEDRSILFLPGDRPVEEMLFNYFNKEGEFCEVYKLEALRAYQVNYYTLMNCDKMPKNLSQKKQYKWWFDMKPSEVQEALVRFWLLNANIELGEFEEAFRKNYQIVSRFT
ncbi:hypothetical protein HMPREF3171_08880 [Corynebacterium sp. HMSC08F01]|uniref:AAA family ATPase n=1 Tax=Corynebacterium sp. HMSC08F01 TaxID=1581139 RepID=UPI0008A4160A|nr:AAA family ATPase [Corynebacterium sp. HMSC08F01]OFT28417.1 hypothetical protein HMPREF3171_08880 [Corynebacterium sp. HMSC08F01]